VITATIDAPGARDHAIQQIGRGHIAVRRVDHPIPQVRRQNPAPVRVRQQGRVPLGQQPWRRTELVVVRPRCLRQVDQLLAFLTDQPQQRLECGQGVVEVWFA
jgi:hypothetical protein